MKGSHIYLCVMITPAEHKVLCELTWDGPSNREIGNRLTISEDTVKSHLKNVMRRIPHITCRTSLVTALLRKTVITRVVEPEWKDGAGPRSTYKPALIPPLAPQGRVLRQARRSEDLVRQ